MSDMSDNLCHVPSAAIAEVTAVADDIAIPISEFAEVAVAKGAAAGDAPRPGLILPILFLIYQLVKYKQKQTIYILMQQ